MLSRRAALKGGAAATCVAGVALSIAVAEAEDEAIPATAEWQASWNRLFDYAELIYQQNERSDSNYNIWFVESGGPKLLDAHEHVEKRLLSREPTTVVGATAVLGCATKLLKARHLACNPREGIHAGLVLRIFVFQYPELRMIDIGHKALLRLAGGTRS